MTARSEAFPPILTADMLRNFRTTPQGCTRPREGYINGAHCIAKCGGWSPYSSDAHVHNEFVADNFLRAAGLKVPASREYTVDFGDGAGGRTIRLALYDDGLTPLMEAWNQGDTKLRATIRAGAVAAYPAQALIAGIDTFTWDNVKVDAEGRLWFVDNGASFDFRACGKPKGWFWKRADTEDPHSGYLALARHPDQQVLRRILGAVNAGELWRAAADVDFAALVATLPETHRLPPLVAYAHALDNRKENMGNL